MAARDELEDVPDELENLPLFLGRLRISDALYACGATMSEASVGDLLAAADRDARRLLAQAIPSDGPSLAAGYPGVLHGAYEVLAAIPNPSVEPRGPTMPTTSVSGSPR
jgi:hypothetical protein